MTCGWARLSRTAFVPVYRAAANLTVQGCISPTTCTASRLFGRAVLSVLHQLDVMPDVLHGHDWQSGLVVAYAHLAGLRTMFTIHNLPIRAAGTWKRPRAGLPCRSGRCGPDALEFHGDLNLMKAGLVFADTSPPSAPPTPGNHHPEYGEGLQGLLIRLTIEGRLSGIINGLDQERWDPRTIPTCRNLLTRQASRRPPAVLRTEFELDDAPILGVVSRLADQKGIDLLIEALPELTPHWNVVVLGGGDPLLTAALSGWSPAPARGVRRGA